jgi:hypothetical protein
MPNIDWQFNQNAYTTSLSHWRAVIKQRAANTFAASIETPDGEVLQTLDQPVDFETAESCILWMMVDIEQTLDKEHPFQQMFATLDLCAARLSAQEHSTHQQRLGYIRQWVATRKTREEGLTRERQAQAPQQILPLDWQALNTTEWFVDTRHGRAIIREERPDDIISRYAPAITHTAWIEDSSGAVYRWSTRSIDFLVADAWIQETLQQLDDPGIAEVFLGNLIFTLDICARLLADEADPMHLARVQYIRELLEMALP